MYELRHGRRPAAWPGRELGRPGDGIIGERLNRSVGITDRCASMPKIWQTVVVNRAGNIGQFEAGMDDEHDALAEIAISLSFPPNP
jgi:hypothetical protein